MSNSRKTIDADETPPPKRRVPSAERRVQLLRAAREIVMRDGVGGVTMSALADAVGVSKPIVYSHFKNSDDVLVELLKKHGEQAVSGAIEQVKGARTIYEYLDRVIDSMFEHMKKDGAIFRRITNGFSSRGDVDAFFLGLQGRTQRAHRDLLLQQGVSPDQAAIAGYALMEMINKTILEIAEKGDESQRDTLKVMVRGAVRSLVGGRGVKPTLPDLT